MQRQAFAPLLRATRSRRDRARPPPTTANAHSTALNVGHVQEETLPPILDIFDVPYKLGESRIHLGIAGSSMSPRKYTPADSVSVQNSFFDPNPLPASLPPPIIFDGPARPRHPALEHASRVRRSGHVGVRQFSQVPSGNTSPGANRPLVQLFEGPARTRRYDHHRPRSGNKPESYHTVMAGIAGLFGCAVVVKHSESNQVERR